MAMLLRWQIEAVRWPISAVATGGCRLLIGVEKILVMARAAAEMDFVIGDLLLEQALGRGFQAAAVNVDEDPTVAALELQSADPCFRRSSLRHWRIC